MQLISIGILLLKAEVEKDTSTPLPFVLILSLLFTLNGYQKCLQKVPILNCNSILKNSMGFMPVAMLHATDSCSNELTPSTHSK